MNDELYASGEIPLRGDVVVYNEVFHQPVPPSREERETWIVTSLCGELVRCKCQGAERWRQAHYVKRLKLIRRK